MSEKKVILFSITLNVLLLAVYLTVTYLGDSVSAGLMKKAELYCAPQLGLKSITTYSLAGYDLTDGYLIECANGIAIRARNMPPG